MPKRELPPSFQERVEAAIGAEEIGRLQSAGLLVIPVDLFLVWNRDDAEIAHAHRIEVEEARRDGYQQGWNAAVKRIRAVVDRELNRLVRGAHDGDA